MKQRREKSFKSEKCKDLRINYRYWKQTDNLISIMEVI